MSDNVEKIIEEVLQEIDKDLLFQAEAHLRDECDLDSLDVFTFLFEIEKRFEMKISEQDIEKYELLRLGKLAEFIKAGQTA